MSYRYEVKVSGKWYPNNVRFATEAEAQRAADIKLFSWSMAESVRVVEDAAPANYVMTDDGPRFLGEPNG